MSVCHTKSNRRGGVYIAVLGTTLIIALLGLTALIGQRIQNRILTASADIRQAQLNAHTAVQLGLLMMKDEADWRTNRVNGDWFTDLDTSAGTCSLNVTDPRDGNLANDADDAVVMLGIGYSGGAQQRLRLTVDARRQPLSSLRSAVAVGGSIDLLGDTLRTNGLITANQIAASSSNVYGTVEAATISGSTYHGTTTQVTSGRLPTMPNWASVFNYYRDNGTQISFGSLNTSPSPNFAKNWSIEDPLVNGNVPNWSGTPPGMPTITADVSQSNNWANTGSYSLKVSNRSHWSAGAVQRIDGFVKPGQQYSVRAWIHAPSLLGTRTFNLTIHTKGTGDAVPSSNAISSQVSCILVLCSPSKEINGTVTAPPWTGDLEYAFIKISDASSGSTADFHVDDLIITEVTTGRWIYGKLLSPNVNTFYTGAPTNASEGKTHGIYWMDCSGQRITIERSRIHGTLLVVNPGPGSSIAYGPIHWSPVVPGYPALLVDSASAGNADFAINATNHVLSEQAQGVNFNPAGAAHPTLGQDAELNDIYPSEIGGLVAIKDDLTYQNRPLIRGQILVGGQISNSSGTLDVDYQPESLLSPPPGFLAPDVYVRRPASAHKAVAD